MSAETSAVSKVSRRLIPYLFFCYILNYLDRFNISFAALEMKQSLGFSDAVYGLGAGMFFVGYVFFEIPSNLILQKVGARIWIARIMVTWGIVSCCMLLVTSSTQFYILRFLLGAAEAGFFPGILFYLAHWIPSKERAGVFALFLTSTSLAGVVGAPLSASLLKLEGVFGWHGWQWLFLVEGLPSILLGLFTFFFLEDSPEKAAWLTKRERSALSKKLLSEKRVIEKRHNYSLAQALTHKKVWQLSLLYFSTIISFYGVSFWLPQIVKNFSGLGNNTVVLLSALPYLAASICMVYVARHSDKTGERRKHVFICAWAAAFALVLGAAFQAGHPVLAFLCLCVTASGIWSTLGPFWSMPGTFLSGTAAAGGLALINSMGNVGGFVGPVLVGWVKERTHHFESGMLVLAATLFIAGLIALSIKPEEKRT